MSAQRRPLRSLADMLKGKQGRFRQNLLGKRVDYSGRSVIVVGPKLKLDQMGIPKRMALELFRPFVISEIIKQGLAHNMRSASRFIEEHTSDVLAILEEIIKDKHVLLNRAPTLHRLSVQAFRPQLVEGLAIKLPPLVCAAFNADFDGDQMAVHLPLSDAAQEEARDIMSAGRNLLKPATGDLIPGPWNDIALGSYYITRKDPPKGDPMNFIDYDEALLAYHFGKVDIHAPIMFHGLETTVGRLIFNNALAGTLPYVNDTITKKKLNALLGRVFESHGMEATRDAIDRVKQLGYDMATVSGITWAMADLIIPKEKPEIIKKADKEVETIHEQYAEGLLTSVERRSRVISVWDRTKNELARLVSGVLPPDNSIYQIVDSGSRGSWSQPIQMMGMKGLVQNPKGETIELPIKSSLKEGLSVLEYFIMTHGARKGTTDTALKTAQAGYLTRRLVDVAQDLTIREDDCRTKEGLEIRREDGKEFNQSLSSRLFSRTALVDVKVGNKVLIRAGEMIDRITAEEIEAAEKLTSIMVRSPITCKTLYGICAKCYGFDLSSNKPVVHGTAVGVLAAQSIGEPGTQLTMRTFHQGGVAGADITHGLPRVEEIFETRAPKGRAILAPFDGVVDKIEERGTLKVVRFIPDKKGKATDVSVPRGTVLYMQAGDKVAKGDRLSEGNLDIHELYEHKGMTEVGRYIVNEVQRIYLSEGASINNKHLEMIVRQMFSRVKITESGDAPDFVMGEIIEKSRFLEVNRQIKKDGGKPAKSEEVLLGITRIALSAESFLSAASFQDTSRVLVKAAIEGKIDRLRGLKENVIIGRLIPAGKQEIPPDSVLHEGEVEEEEELAAMAESS
jgi:DNA-directed RNA polymerase subunit beta'